MQNKLPTLYKAAKSGATYQWTIVVENDHFHTEAGKVGGKITVSENTYCKPKNVGRANATTAEEQALAEAQARWDTRHKREYTTNIKEVATARPFFEPMLAKRFEDVKDLQYPMFVQPKFDGIRAIFTKDVAQTRNGEDHHCVPHIRKVLEPFFAKYPNAILDGELYNHALHDDFNKISSLVRKKKLTDHDLEAARKMIKFYCYDAPKFDNDEDWNELTPYKVRYQVLKEELSHLDYIVVVDNKVAHSEDDVKLFHNNFVDLGYEGAIIRVIDSPYENGRTKNLLKHKIFESDEFILRDIREGKGNKAGMAAHADFLTHEGKPFTANLKGKQWWREELLKNKDQAIGKACTVEFFRYTPDRIPRFPYLVDIRDYE